MSRLHLRHDQAATGCRGKRPQAASSTQMSSSNSSQRNARPFSRSKTFSRRFCGTDASSGYLVAGKLTTRSSASSRHTRRPSIQQRVAAVSVVPSCCRQALLYYFFLPTASRQHVAVKANGVEVFKAAAPGTDELLHFVKIVNDFASEV